MRTPSVCCTSDRLSIIDDRLSTAIVTHDSNCPSIRLHYKTGSCVIGYGYGKLGKTRYKPEKPSKNVVASSWKRWKLISFRKTTETSTGAGTTPTATPLTKATPGGCPLKLWLDPNGNHYGHVCDADPVKAAALPPTPPTPTPTPTLALPVVEKSTT